MVSMFTKTTSEKETAHLVTPLLFVIVVAAIAAYVMIYATPIIPELPVQITEEVKIIAVTERGVIIETSFSVAVETDQYVGLPGEIIKVTYHVPMKYLLDQQIRQEKYLMFHPDP